MSKMPMVVGMEATTATEKNLNQMKISSIEIANWATISSRETITSRKLIAGKDGVLRELLTVEKLDPTMGKDFYLGDRTPRTLINVLKNSSRGGGDTHIITDGTFYRFSN